MLAGKLLVRNEAEILKERQRARKAQKELLLKTQEEKLEMAERMLAKGMSPEDVSEITKLSIGKIKNLQPMPS